MNGDHGPGRDDVLRSLIATEDGRACHRSSYARHPLARVLAQGAPTTGSVARSIREIGDMLVTADGQPEFRHRLADLERLSGLLGEYHGRLRKLIDGEYADACGAFDV